MEGELWGLAVHPSSKVAATASDDGSLRIWDLETHKMTGLVKLGRPARCVGFSRDGATMAIGMKDGNEEYVLCMFVCMSVCTPQEASLWLTQTL